MTPVVIFAFARADLLAHVFDGLREQTRLPEKIIVFVDKPKDSASAQTQQGHRDCLAYLSGDSGPWELSVHVRAQNHGLRKNIISGLNEVFAQSPQAVILEDDIVPNPFFYEAMLQALEAFGGHAEIKSITGFSHLASSEFADEAPSRYQAICREIAGDWYLTNRFHCWSWATWAPAWQEMTRVYEQDDKHLYPSHLHLPKTPLTYDLAHLYREYITGGSNSWAVPQGVYYLKQNWLQAEPRYSLIKNVGLNDIRATHTTRMARDFDRAYRADFNPQVPDELKMPAGIDQFVGWPYLAKIVLHRVWRKLCLRLGA